MPIVVQQVGLAPGDPEDVLLERIARKLRVPVGAIGAFSILRCSIDARRRGAMQFSYQVEVALRDGDAAEQRVVRQTRGSDARMLDLPPDEPWEAGTRALMRRPVVIGFGPAGMFAGLMLARRGFAPIILERGQPVRQRHRDIMVRFYQHREFDPESNLLFGEGGAGTYSDGKLYTRVNHPYVRDVLDVLYQHGADADILTSGRPHIGSDRLPNICMRIRASIEAAGGEVRFGERLEDMETGTDGTVRAVVTTSQRLETPIVVLGIGHSARDTLQRLAGRGVRLEARPFQMGVRIEHPQALVDRWQYRELAGHPALPPADYHVVARTGGADIYSFCMCPGGIILPTNEAPFLVATNGASRSSRGGPFANSGLVVTVSPSAFGDDALAGLAYQRRWEASAFAAAGRDYAVPAQRAADFVAERQSNGTLETSYPLGAAWTDLRAVLPPGLVADLKHAISILGQRLPGFDGEEAIVTGPETRASSPVRIVRDAATRMSVSTPGLYPVGEGAGYAGGIISAAIDGMKTADAITRSFACPSRSA